MNNKEMKDLIKRARKFAKPFRVTGDGFRLKDINPAETLDLTSEDKPRAKEHLLWVWNSSPSFRTCFTPKIAGPCCSFSKKSGKLAI